MMFACFVVVAGPRSLLLWLVYLIFGFDCVGFFPCCRCRLVRFSLPVRDAPTKPTQLNVTHSENTHLFRFFQNNVQKKHKIFDDDDDDLIQLKALILNRSLNIYTVCF